MKTQLIALLREEISRIENNAASEGDVTELFEFLCDRMGRWYEKQALEQWDAFVKDVLNGKLAADENQ